MKDEFPYNIYYFDGVTPTSISVLRRFHRAAKSLKRSFERTSGYKVQKIVPLYWDIAREDYTEEIPDYIKRQG